jgi:hypothetical protein
MQYAPPIAVLGLALGLAACHPSSQRAVTRLDCPATAGELTRVSAAADGRSCVYRGAGGADVSLRLLAVQGDPHATLDRIEQEVRARMASATTVREAPPQAKAKAEEKLGLDARDPEAARAVAEAASDAAPPVKDRRETGDGDHAEVELPGVRIRAHDDDADVQLGPMRIIATEGDAVIKISRDVRLRGEALSREKRGLRATFLMVEDGRAAGYEAAGPRTGPITVAVVQARGDEDDGDVIGHRLRSDVRRLVRRNGGA